MREITREEANEIIKAGLGGPRRRVTICYAGKWYDIRGMSDEEVMAFVSSLTGIPQEEIPGRSADLEL